MGGCNIKSENPDKTSALSVNNFQFHYVIGRGGFGKVWKVEKRKNKVNYAMKEMNKSRLNHHIDHYIKVTKLFTKNFRIITKKSVNSVMNERQLLSCLKHPFIVNMVHAFQDRENLYLVMDLMTGGDLRYHLGKNRRFTEQQTKFFVGCVLAGLEYIHGNGILHRDIKPENLVFEANGYLRITDFGIARVWRPDNSSDTSGTPGYMAPEIMCRQNHGVGVDYYALGIICYESMMGRRPYNGKNRKEIRDQILAKQVQIKRNEIPEGWSLEAADFINKLIQRKPTNRLGLEGPSELKTHPWLKDYPWDKLMNKELEPPYIFDPNEDNFDFRQAVNNDQWKDTNPEVQKQNAILLRRNSIQELFNGYDYDMESIQPNSNVTTTLFMPHQLNVSQQNLNSTTILSGSLIAK